MLTGGFTVSKHQCDLERRGDKPVFPEDVCGNILFSLSMMSRRLSGW